MATKFNISTYINHRAYTDPASRPEVATVSADPWAGKAITPAQFAREWNKGVAARAAHAYCPCGCGTRKA